jgi:glucokinase
MLLAGDVGGTKTDLAVYSLEAGAYSPLTEAEMPSADYPSLQALVTEFRLKVKMPIERASFDVAGPVINGRVKVTNLPWEIDEVSLARALNFKFVQLGLDREALHINSC